MFLLFYVFVNCLLLCTSKSIVQNADPDDGYLFFYASDVPIIWYSKESSTNDTRAVIRDYNANIKDIEYYAEERTIFWTTSNGELYSAACALDKGFKVKDLFGPSSNESAWTNDHVKLLYKEKEWTPRSIALDHIGKKLYIIDSTARSVDVFNMYGTNKARVFKHEFLIPMEIVLDPYEGLMFLLAENFKDETTEIYRMNMDGSSSVLIEQSATDQNATIKLDMKLGLAVDKNKKRLFFGNRAKNIIESIDYSGTEKLTIAKLKNIKTVSITTDENRLYWAESFGDLREIFSMVSLSIPTPLDSFIENNFNYTISSCKINDQYLCDEKSIRDLVIDTKLSESYKQFPDGFKAFSMTMPRKIPNPCDKENGGCEDVCLLRSSGINDNPTFGCVCRTGRQLNLDNKTCSTTKEEYVTDNTSYVTGKSVILIISKVHYLYNERDNETLYPMSKDFYHRIAYEGPHIAHDYNLDEKYEANIFSSFDRDLVKYVNGTEVVVLRKNVKPVLTYDWVSRNLYFVKESNNKSELNILAADNPDEEICLGEIDSPTSMIAHPYRGYIFVSTFDDKLKKSSIIRFNMDGSDKLILPYSGTNPISFSIDMASDKLYWVDEPDKNKQYSLIDFLQDEDEEKGEDKYTKSKENKTYIRSSNLDGSDMKIFSETSARDITSIHVYDTWIFLRVKQPPFSFTTANQVYRYDLQSGKASGAFRIKDVFAFSSSDPFSITDLPIRKTDTQYLSLKNPCTARNGDCEVFCFALPKNSTGELDRTCGCSKTKKLCDDGLHCKLQPETKAISQN